MSIQQAFNTAATEYDKLRRTLIPCFDDFYQTAIEVIPFDRTASLNVLDLGAGTGLYNPGSGRVMQKIGMLHEGYRRQHLRKWETFEDIEQYGILKSDWQQMIAQSY